jgi:hypothetical protein
MTEIQTTRAKEISRLHQEIGEHLRRSLANAIRIGELLSEQKATLQHGEFGRWISENLPFTDRTARNYMRIFDNRNILKTETVSDLGTAYKLLSRPQLPAAKEDENVPGWIPPAGLMTLGYCDRAGHPCLVALVRDLPSQEFVRVYAVDLDGETIEGWPQGLWLPHLTDGLKHLGVDEIQWDGCVPVERDGGELATMLHRAAT